MLRITIHSEPTRRTFQLEGKLAGPWVDELERCWQSTLANPNTPALRFDLTGVTFIDTAGKEFLAERYAEGAELIVAGCQMRAFAAEIANSPKANAQRNGGAR
jgi:anti-anti-sigma regulatory factor